jgi:hypothetical protein
MYLSVYVAYNYSTARYVRRLLFLTHFNSYLIVARIIVIIKNKSLSHKGVSVIYRRRLCSVILLYIYSAGF